MYNVSFSKTDSSLITTSGDGHINFWRIVTTGSGVKIDMTRGMFNNKPVTDIESFVQLGDGKIVTGCEWGNLLLWEHGAVKVKDPLLIWLVKICLKFPSNSGYTYPPPPNCDKLNCDKCSNIHDPTPLP